MKNAMKKLLSLMLVAVLLVSAVPFKASALDDVKVPVDVYIDGTKISEKELSVGSDGVDLTEEVAWSLIRDKENRAFVKWASTTKDDVTGEHLSQDWAKSDGYKLSMYLKTVEKTVEEVTVNVDVYVNNTFTSTKQIKIGEQNITLSAAYGLSLLNSTTNRSVDKWVNNSGNVVTDASLSRQWVLDHPGYSLSLYVKESIPEPEHKDPVDVPVYVYINDAKVNTTKNLTVGESGVTLTRELAMNLLSTTANRTFVKWVNNRGEDVTGKTLSNEWAAQDGYFLNMYIKETVPVVEDPEDDSVLIVGNGDKKILLTLDMNYEGSKDRFVKVTDPNTKMGTIMMAIKENNMIPNRTNYTFAGWYWDDDFDYPVKDNEYLTDSSTTALRIYARWTRNSSANNVFLKIYLNGKTSSPAKIVDISSYGDADGSIDIYEARRAAGNYYSSTGYDGLFTDTTWNGGAYNNSDQADSVAVNANGDTFIYMMLWGAKTTSTSSSSSSSGTADTSNYKTGDTIYTVMTVMGLSVAALAAVCYVSKKRAF